jgi:hypothetical protein
VGASDAENRKRILEGSRTLFKAGTIDRKVDCRIVPALFASTVGFILDPARLITLTVPPAEAVDAFIRTLLGGILTEKARRGFFDEEESP